MGIVGSMPRMFNKFRKGAENWRMRILWDQRRPVITVAQDGTGDFQKVEDALRIVDATGGKIFVKSGSYSVPIVPGLTSGRELPSFLFIEGEGLNTIITFAAPTGLNYPTLSLVNTSKIIFADLHLKLSINANTDDDISGIEIGGAEDITFRNCKLEQLDNTMQGIIGGASGTTATRIIFKDCTVVTAAGGDYAIGRLENWIDVKLLNCTFNKEICSEYMGNSGDAHTNTRIDECKITGGGVYLADNGSNCLISDCTEIDGNITCDVDTTRIRGNKLSATKTITVNGDYCVASNNIIDLAVIDNGVGNKTDDNVIY